MDTFDIEIKEVFEKQPNVDFILNGEVFYGFRFRKLESSFGSLLKWLQDFNELKDVPPDPVHIKEEDITVIISCKKCCGEGNCGEHIGHFTVGDDWDGDAFDFVAPIKTVITTLYERLKEYFINHPTEFSQEWKDIDWNKG